MRPRVVKLLEFKFYDKVMVLSSICEQLPEFALFSCASLQCGKSDMKDVFHF